jgi:hypothetical protein
LYDVTDDYLERRATFRPEHLTLARAAADRGELVLAGAFSDPADTGLLIFEGADASVAEAFAHADPYVANGLVRSWRVRPWTVVVGRGLANQSSPTPV